MKISPYLTNIGYLNLKDIIILLLGILVSIAFARLVPQYMFGYYQLILALLVMLSILALPGFQTAIVQSVARDFDKSYRKVVKIRFKWSLIGTLVLMTIGIIYCILEELFLSFLFIISGIFFPFMFSFNSWDFFLQGKEKFDLSARWSILQQIIVSFSVIFAIIFFSNYIIVLISAYLISVSITNVFLYRRSLKLVNGVKEDPDLFRYGFFLTKISFLGLLASNIDKLLVGLLIGVDELAVYVIVSLIAIRLKDLLKNFTTIFLPKLSKEQLNLIDILKNEKGKLSIISVILVTFAVLFYFTIPIVNFFLFGENYAQHIFLSQIFSISVFLAIPLSFLGRVIQSKKDTLAFIITNPIFYIIRIGLNLILICNFGLIGIIWAFNLSYIIWFFLHLFSLIFTDIEHIRE
ncbi:MAG: oligosaccharide flippase family protein [Candidatus Hermodarchaeota archaeon]